MNKNIIAPLVIVVLIAIGLVFFGARTPAGPVACTMEAKLCPDGSAVGRAGPLCEFAPCPPSDSNSTGTTEAKLNQSVNAFGVGVTPLAVLEDSRCPTDVVCIQAGTVRANMRISDEIETMEKIMALGESVSFGNIDIVFDRVAPAPVSTREIEQSDYRFSFIIKKHDEPAPGNESGSGVRGKVLLGPTCPVMRDPPDPQCADKPYATTIQVIKAGSPVSSPFATTKSDTEGKYEISLPPGAYSLQPSSGAVFPRCTAKEVTIIPATMLEADLSCDTGIR